MSDLDYDVYWGVRNAPGTPLQYFALPHSAAQMSHQFVALDELKDGHVQFVAHDDAFLILSMPPSDIAIIVAWCM